MSLVDAFRGRNQPQLIPDPHLTALSPATYYLREWDEYLFEAPLADRVRFGTMEAECLTDGLFRPLKGNASAASDRDGWCFLQQLQDEDFARVLDALLSNNDWDATIRDWNDKLHSVAKSSAEIAAALGNLEQDSGWNVYIQKTLDASTAVAAGEEIGQRIMDGFMDVSPLWEAVIPEADREYLHGRKTPLPPSVDRPQFHGSRGWLEAPLSAVLAWCVNPGAPDVKAVEDALRDAGPDKTVQQAVASSLYPKTAKRVQRMLSRLHTDGFAAFG